MIVVAPLTALALLLTYLLIGLVVCGIKLWECAFEIEDANDLIQFLFIVGISAVLWPVLLFIWLRK